MANGFKWKITLADDSVKNEGVDAFDLAWENANAVKKLEWVGEGAITDTYEVDFADGKFYKNDSEIDAGIGSASKLVMRARNQVRVDESGSLPLGTIYLGGYVNGSAVSKVLFLHPQYTIGTGPEPTSYTVSYQDHI